MSLKSKILGFVASLMLAAPVASNASLITYDFTWTGSGGYTMTGFFTFDDANAADGAIRDNEVLSLFFQGFLNGVSIGSNGSAPTQAGFNFNFNTVLGQFFLNGTSNTGSGQLWNFSGAGLGFGAGDAASTMTLGGFSLGFIANPVPMTATRRSAIPEPGTVALLGLALGGLAMARRRKAR